MQQYIKQGHWSLTMTKWDSSQRYNRESQQPWNKKQKKTKHRIIPMIAEKTWEKSYHSSIITTLTIRQRKNRFNNIRTIYYKTRANIILNWKILTASKNIRRPIFIIPLQYWKTNRQETRKRKSKVLLSVDTLLHKKKKSPESMPKKIAIRNDNVVGWGTCSNPVYAI